METESLRWFQLVADGMTVTEVSDIFAVSQPGVSRALARLESEVGTPLLRRSGRVLRLTHAGAAFKAHVDRVVNDLDDALAAVTQLVDPETGVVSIAFPLSLGTWFVPRLLADFGREHPDVRFVLRRTVEQTDTPSALLLTRRVDLELTTRRVRAAAVRWQPIGPEPLVAAVPGAHPLAGRSAVSLADLDGEPFVLLRAPSRTGAQVRDLLAAAGLEPDVRFEVDDLPAVHGFVAAGLGVAVVPALGLDPAPGGDLALVPLTDPGAHREIGIAWLEEERLLPAARAFRGFALGPRGRAHARGSDGAPT